MRKRWFLVGMIFLLVPWLFGGCGIAQEQYDAIVADLGKAQQEMQSLKAAHDKVITENKDLQAENTSLMTEKESLEADYSKLKTENAVVTRELAKIKESYEGVYQELIALQVVYPPKYFSTSQELESWIQSNAISDTPIHSNFFETYKAYERCLEIQESALGDGFIISVAVEGGREKEGFDYGAARSVYCQAETSDGIYWWFPDRDEIVLIEFYGKIESNFAGNPTHGIAPLTVNFTNLSKGEITSVYWEFGDGETSRTRHPTHTYTLPSIYSESEGNRARWFTHQNDI